MRSNVGLRATIWLHQVLHGWPGWRDEVDRAAIDLTFLKVIQTIVKRGRLQWYSLVMQWYCPQHAIPETVRIANIAVGGVVRWCSFMRLRWDVVSTFLNSVSIIDPPFMDIEIV